MSLQIFTDSSANLPEELLKQRHIQVVTLTVLVNGEELLCYEPDSHFDGNAFYERMRKDDRLELKTSMINTITFIDAFTPALQAGDDVIYIAMSSGISGTYASGRSAAFMLHETFPDRTILAVDTLAASMGEGLQVLEAADMRDRGCSAAEILAYLETRRVSIRQHFLVDDLMFLKRGGRISGTAALAGTIMNIKPIMKADACGRIVLDRKVLGRKKALNALADIFDAYLLMHRRIAMPPLRTVAARMMRFPWLWPSKSAIRK